MNILQDNPYRLLGVYSNSPTKERLANRNRMKAFLKVGKPVSFPLDLPQYFSSINRTEISVAEAEAKLTLPKEQILYAQFWFIKKTPLDDVAFNQLYAGEIDKAEDIWKKKECASSLQNRIVAALMRDDYNCAITCAETLYGNQQYVGAFISAVVGDGCSLDASMLSFSFLDALCEEIEPNELLPFVTNSAWKSHLADKVVKPLVESIEESINTAKKSRKKGPEARLKAGNLLMKNTQKALSQLKNCLSKTDMQYQMIADKLGIAILQCSIDYFNDSEEPDAAHKAFTLQEYANSIVEGQMAKDRCKENLQILQRIIKRLPPSEVFAEDKAIKEQLHKYCSLPDKICHAIDLLNNTKPHLQAIKSKMGETDTYYLNISTQVVNNALINIIEEVNAVQSSLSTDNLMAALAIARLKSVLTVAWEATRIMDGFDMESDFRRERYNKNRAILKKMCEDLHISTISHLMVKRNSSTSHGAPIWSVPAAPPQSTWSVPAAPPQSTATHSPSESYQSSPTDNNSDSDNTQSGCLVGLLLIIIFTLTGFAIGEGLGAICGFGIAALLFLLIKAIQI